MKVTIIFEDGTESSTSVFPNCAVVRMSNEPTQLGANYVIAINAECDEHGCHTYTHTSQEPA